MRNPGPIWKAVARELGSGVTGVAVRQKYLQYIQPYLTPQPPGTSDDEDAALALAGPMAATGVLAADAAAANGAAGRWRRPVRRRRA